VSDLPEIIPQIIPLADAERAKDAAVAALREGRLVVVPTDTAYAVLADAFQPLATRKVFDAKRRTRHVPLPVVIRSPRQAVGLVEGIPEPAERLMASYWPGPVTLVLPAAEGLTWDLGESRGTVMLRMPADELVTSLVQEIGPLVCTGANRAGMPVPRTAQEAAEQLGAAVAVVLDGGTREAALSTVVDVSGERVEVLREGAVSEDDITDVATGAVGWGMRPQRAVQEARHGSDDQPAAPGAAAEE